MTDITKVLHEYQDTDYRDFQIKLIPGMDPDRMIGVRTPQLRTIAKQLAKEPDIDLFLDDLPHKLFEEDQLHAFILSELKDYDKCIRLVDKFLSYVNNWATCDQLSPKAFKKHRPELLEHIKRWIASAETYRIRFGVGMLMQHFLDEDFDPSYLEIAANIRSDEYYVNMMTAWYFATALAKQYDSAVIYIQQRRLDDWTHNKAIQKSVESYRIPADRKEYLKSLRIRKQ